jgi:hypothetical protein
VIHDTKAAMIDACEALVHDMVASKGSPAAP